MYDGLSTANVRFSRSQRDEIAAVRLLRPLLRRQGYPTIIVTGILRSFGSALRDIGFPGSHEQ
ncbi:MAG: hypothetical protein CR217_13145 [Beijerinckiaceae bacterium]|nr:MAG: hypothetical protein CR217_13145 [Beijerinckiaceae bacterium]